MLMLTREQAFSLMEWPFLDVMAPELVVYRDRLQGAVNELVKAAKDSTGCPPCVRLRYRKWEKLWLTQLHVLFHRDRNVITVVEQFLATSSVPVSTLAEHAHAALGATQTADK